MAKKKILMFGWEFPPMMAGGLGVACQELVKALSSRGTEINLILPKITGEEENHGFNIYSAEEWESTLIQKLKEKNIHHIKTISSTLPLDGYLGINKQIDLNILSKEALKEIVNSRNLKKRSTLEAISLYGHNLIDNVHKYNQIAGSIAVNMDFDAIHCHDWLTIGAGIMAKKQTGKPLIVHIHCTEYDRCPGYGNEEIHRIERIGCQVADRVIAVSNWTKQILIDKYGINPGKIRVVHNGINNDGGFPEPRRHRHESPKILFLGRITYQKGPNYFLEAASKVLSIRPDAKFIVAGKGDMLDYLRGRSVELGIQDKIEFLGGIPAEKVTEIYRDVDCFVLSSVSEPFGLTVLEALSQRLPVIVSKQSGVSEVLRHILRYDFWDVDRLASLILSVINYEPLSQELREKAIDDLDTISWEASAQKVENLYSEI